jgi:hypothetical protein
MDWPVAPNTCGLGSLDGKIEVEILMSMPSVIKIPQELAREPDRLAEAEHKPRDTFVVELLRHDVRRAKQREALRFSAGAWNPADHPELIRGGAACVEKIRSEPDQRFGSAIRRQKG